jgi:hypothetical protein
MIIVVKAALPPTRTLPTTSWGEGVSGADASFAQVGAIEANTRRPL